MTDITHYLKKFEGKLKMFALKLTKNPTDAEDLYQDTVMLILIKKNSFQSGSNFIAWADTIMRNVFINTCRKKSRRQQILGEITTKNFQPSFFHIHTFNRGESNIAVEEISTMINALKQENRLLLWKIYEGYPYDEIAEQLGVPVGTIKSRLFWARKRLKIMYLKANQIDKEKG